jgi:phage/plasmid-like protein (TIGR03299 family)
MSHDLDFTTGRAAFAYVGAEAWHGYGQKLEPDASIDVWAKAAGLDWNIRKAQVGYRDQNGKRHTMDDKVVLFRDDTGAALSVMSKARYNPTQPREILEGYKTVTEGLGQLETAGALQGGRKFWALACLDMRGRGVKRVDEIKPYLLLSTSADGTMSNTARLTGVRVVCKNTLNFSAMDTAGDIRIPHSRKFTAEEARDALAGANEAFAEYIGRGDKLANVKVTDRQAMDFFARLYGPEPADDFDTPLPDISKIGQQQRNTLNALMLAYTRGPGADLDTARGTAWGLLNAVTYFQDHKARTRGDKRASRFNSAQFGQGAQMKQRAANLTALLAA